MLVSGFVPALAAAGVSAGVVGGSSGRLRQHQRHLRLGQPDRSAYLLPNVGAGFDQAHHLVEHTELAVPRLDYRFEVRVGGHHGLDLRALGGIERPEHILRGKRDMVFAVSHHTSPRHSLMSNMLRRSHVFTVFTGAENFSASCSRLQPL